LDKKIIISSFLLAIFIILFLRLDSFSGMREYHGNISLVLSMTFVVGISLFMKIFFSQKREYKIFFSKLGILIAGFLIPILPYLFYNISNTDEISLKTLIFQNPPEDKIKFEELKILIENESND
jgi:cellulose synthase/poly-beta-1,6-N-acetylglucosamine synthase-like glycosyltransferase